MLREDRKLGYGIAVAADNVERLGESATRLSSLVGNNLRRLRHARGFSLERLADLSGVSRAMLGQIETGKSAPTINLLGRIADALGVTIPSLIANPERTDTVIIRREERPTVTSSQGRFICRALFPCAGPQRAEFYELVLAPSHQEVAGAYESGVRKSLSVVSGAIDVTVGSDAPTRLEAGDTILFSAAVQHTYHNPEPSEAKAFLLITHLDRADLAFS